VSLLQREDARSFEWAFEKFAESMSDGSSDSAGGGDWRPDAIFTDSDVAMGAAIKRVWQGLTLVHFSAQRERFLWDRGAFRGRLEGVWQVLGVFMGCLQCILCQKRLRLS